jgi:hypothetical protein
MIHGSVTASCNYLSKTFLGGMSRERFRLTGMRANADRPTPDDRFDSLLPVSQSFEISRGWIENDNYVSHTKKELQLNIHLSTHCHVEVSQHAGRDFGAGMNVGCSRR